MSQTWSNLTFLHWPYDPLIVRRLLPRDLTLDTFEGKAWVGLAPFILSEVRLFNLPAIPYISTFPETNVRTYVIGPDGEPGVWFFTLEAERLLAVLVARHWFKLPYRWSSMQANPAPSQIEYQSRRHRPFGNAFTDMAVSPENPVTANDFDNFLTARFRLYTAAANRLAYGAIEHEPWPLQKARIERLNENLIANCGLPAPSGQPVVHFSRELSVKIAPLRWL